VAGVRSAGILLSAGLLLWRRRGGSLEVFIAHMGGPFWARKDAAAWSIPKGEFGPDENALLAARREFAEEIGVPAPEHDYVLLGEFRQSSGKIVSAFAAESEFDVTEVHSNTFPVEWPPRSGRIQEFPEIDRAEWMSVADASWRLVKGQVAVIAALEALVG
jgi:predicted NUDIX family NTP pyrophosphohydrolase